MYKLTIAALTFLLCGSLLSASAQSDAEMKAMMAYATPGDVHKMMAKSVGNWDCQITMWMQPGAPPTTSSATAKYEMILGGRYLQATTNGEFSGMPFQGVSVTGYDNSKKKFLNTWIDNMGTGIMYLTGTWDDATKSITYTGNMVDPGSGKDIPIKEVLTMVDDQHQRMEMFYNMAGKDFKAMEIKFTMK